MTNNFSDNNSSNSSIYLGKVTAEDLSVGEKLNHFKAAAEEVEKRVAAKRVELQNQAFSHVDSLLSKKLNLEEDFSRVISCLEVHSNREDNYFTAGVDALLEKLFRFFNFTDSELEMDIDPQIYRMVKEKEEKNHVATIIKLIHDKLKALIKKVFSKDLNFDERLDEEMKELQKKLGSGELSMREFTKILNRLKLLQNLKLKIQLFLVEWLISSVAELLSVGITVLTETIEEEDKKTEKTLLREEATEEACKDVEIKVDREKRNQLMYDSIISVSSTGVWLRKIIFLAKEEQESLPESFKITRSFEHKDNIDKNKSKILKHDEQKIGQREKKEGLKVSVCSLKPIEGKLVKGGITFDSKSQGVSTGYNIDFNEGINEIRTASINKCSAGKKESKSISGHEMDVLGDELKEKVIEKSSQRGKSATVNNHQPTGECKGVKVNNYVDLIKTLERASLRGR
ncbi:hypothetical protein [Wolbachia endosymbiont of Dirofilaria (Dirofilaria) immitis]|uniref:hypothetical protein n=1 Tax=Wolbachia endosymbiont of Dirofilaria (Dirofilaria) immitis TaxID=1812115 RepID=UPI0015893FE5|nr:hypothetical protein [Wolbachia endosymbiont of Dirofilaria (Dirofilaria) immitis]QKX02251.1 hypothetical protein GOY12_01570 [Wolbachia endosymbiont of Dirofilaria (Dirofilaria) immitis]